jgi:hypothetical protein
MNVMELLIQISTHGNKRPKALSFVKYILAFSTPNCCSSSDL